MAKIKLISDSTSPDDDIGSIVTLEYEGVDYLGSFPDIFLHFLQAAGYNYATSVSIYCRDKEFGDKEFHSL